MSTPTATVAYPDGLTVTRAPVVSVLPIPAGTGPTDHITVRDPAGSILAEVFWHQPATNRPRP
jgi:hypothetical protein